MPGRDGALRRGAHLLGSRHRLDPADIGAACLQPPRLLRERGDRGLLGHFAEGNEQLAGRAHRSGHDDRASGSIGDRTREFRTRLVDLEDAVLGLVQLQPRRVRPKRVGQDHVGAGIHERAVKARDRLRIVDVPEVGRIACGQAGREEVGAGRAVGEEHAVGSEEISRDAMRMLILYHAALSTFGGGPQGSIPRPLPCGL